MFKFDILGVEVSHAWRPSGPAAENSFNYELIVDTDEDDRRLELLHQNVMKYGTISNTVATATQLQGIIGRKV
jgi:hypothetical protein